MERPPPSQHQVEQAHLQLRTAEHTIKPSAHQQLQPACRLMNQPAPDMVQRPPRAYSLPPSNRQGEALGSAMQSIPNHHQVTAFHHQHGAQQQVVQPIQHHMTPQPPQAMQQHPRPQSIDCQRAQCLPISTSQHAGLSFGETSINMTGTLPNVGLPISYMDNGGVQSQPHVHPMLSLSSLASALPSTPPPQQQQLVQQQWQQQLLQQQMQQQQLQQLSMGMHPQMGGLFSFPPYTVSAKPPTTFAPVGATSGALPMQATQFLPMRLLGDLRLYVPHREPFLGEGGSVHMYLLGKQVKHTVATDEAEECTQDILALIESRQVPSESTMPLLIHDRQVVCGGPEVCLRYLAKKLGHYGSDHLKDALLDRLLTDLNTWFNVQQAAIQAILSPQTMSKDAISDYVKSRFHFYDEAEKLLAFFNQMHATTNQGHSPSKPFDASLRQPGGAQKRGGSQLQQHPFFLGDEDSIADYFLFALIDDDQRIAECLTSNSSLLGGSGEDSQDNQQRSETKNTDSGDKIPMHFFDEAPHLHALYLALLNLPLIQEALLSTENQYQPAANSEETMNLTKETIYRREAEQKQADERQAPNIATEASTAASVNESPMQLFQPVHLPPVSNAKRPEHCAYSVDPNMGCFMRAPPYSVPTTPAGSLHTTLPTTFCAYNGHIQQVVALQPVINQSHVTPYASQYSRMLPQPPHSTYSWHPVLAPTQTSLHEEAEKRMPATGLHQNSQLSERAANTNAQ